MYFSYKYCTARLFDGISSAQLQFFMLSVVAFFFIFNFFTLSYEVNKQKHLVDSASNRSFCCLTIGAGAQDICGRENCTWPCADPKPTIPQLDDHGTNRRAGNNAFFVESSGRGVLNIRQACSVESLAYQNPNLTVFVLFIDTEINSSSTIAFQLANQYKNIHLISVKMDDYLAGTPLEHWYHCTDWRKGPHRVEHLSDGLRLLTIAKYGGYYFDLDIIHIRPTTFLRNFFNAESQDLIANGIIHADYGNPVIQMAANQFAKDYMYDFHSCNQ